MLSAGRQLFARRERSEPMLKRAISGWVLGAGLSLVSAAFAQPGLSTGPDYDLIHKADRIDEGTTADLAKLHREAVAALQAQDFASAEIKLRELLQFKPSTPDANFLMGLAKTGLEKWPEARGFLEIAVEVEPKRPEPKTRLGLIYAKFDRPDAAKEQRDALAALDAECRNTCADATWIADGIKAIDQALASSEAASRLSAAALASVAAAPEGGDKNFDPAKYSLVAFSDPLDLYDLLTQPGRCPPNKMAEPRQPCALILYRPVEDTADTLAANFKPVFKVVSRNAIWTIHDKELQKVKIENLYYDEEQIIGKKNTIYNSVALVGNAENDANCAASKPCLSHLVSQDMFRMYGNMPDRVVTVIWGEGMKDPGVKRLN
jgi:tetratricopeptide (TPR) repeat protein